MSDPISAADQAVLQRRGFLRGGALLAAAAGGAVAASAGSVLPASAETTNYLSITVAIPAERLMDTRSEAGRASIVGGSEGALDSKNRLTKGSYVDVAVSQLPPEDQDVEVLSAFVTVTSRDSVKGGSITLGPPGSKPDGRTLSFDKGRTISTGTIVGPQVVGTNYVVRIYASATGHVTLDLTGVVLIGPQGDTEPVVRRPSPASTERLLKAARVNGR